MSALRKGKRRGKAPSRKAMRKRAGVWVFSRPVVFVPVPISDAFRDEVLAQLRALSSDWRAVYVETPAGHAAYFDSSEAFAQALERQQVRALYGDA